MTKIVERSANTRRKFKRIFENFSLLSKSLNEFILTEESQNKLQLSPRFGASLFRAEVLGLGWLDSE